MFNNVFNVARIDRQNNLIIFTNWLEETYLGGSRLASERSQEQQWGHAAPVGVPREGPALRDAGRHRVYTVNLHTTSSKTKGGSVSVWLAPSDFLFVTPWPKTEPDTMSFCSLDNSGALCSGRVSLHTSSLDVCRWSVTMLGSSWAHFKRDKFVFFYAISKELQTNVLSWYVIMCLVIHWNDITLDQVYVFTSLIYPLSCTHCLEH